ncbi:unnamed protein product [Mesocestoides corti]|uniref:Late endosomal/lysosomal adaptor and MAPK and MTOR activator 4 n=1 Tax=Mesocestoides corti TaxID=53468 RepID=A0A0R3ULV8_MESCO|nr:unnamed protein product [Mesocestoides corti]
MSTNPLIANLASQTPGWLGTLAMNLDGVVIHSAGELKNDDEIASKFFELARHVGRYMELEGPQANQEDPFKRLTVMCSKHAYVMTCIGDTIYVVKRRLPQIDSESSVDETVLMRDPHSPINV